MENVTENKMGVMPVRKLVVTMALPIMISMLVQALYNVVDSVFVAQLNEQALTAVTLAFPMQNLMIAVASGTSVGVNALLARSLGERRFDSANAAANTGILLSFLCFAAFIIIGFTVSGPFIAMQSSSDITLTYGTQYLTICCSLSIGMFMQIMMEKLLQATGRTLFSMFSQIVGAVINIIFDPLLIFGIGPFPRLEVAGAAYATVLGQIVAGAFALFLNIKFNKDIRLGIRSVFSPSLSIIKRVYQIGIPSMLMLSVGTVMTTGMNAILTSFTESATAAFGAFFKLQSFFILPAIGLNNGVVPILAYNYGAANRGRIKEAIKFSMIFSIVLMSVGCLVFQLFPDPLLSMFAAGGQMRSIGETALRVCSLGFPLAGASILMSAVFQAFAKSIYSLINSLMRQVAVLLPLALIFSVLCRDVAFVWWAFPISEVASLLVSITFIRKLNKNIISKLPEDGWRQDVP